MTVIGNVRKNGEDRHFSGEHFNRDKGTEWLFKLQPDGTVLGYISEYPDCCPSEANTEFFLVPPIAAETDKIKGYKVTPEEFEIAARAGTWYQITRKIA